MGYRESTAVEDHVNASSAEATPTARANMLAIPLGHRDEDALEASPAAHLFGLDRRYRTNSQNHALAGMEWIRGWGKDRRHKRLTKIYDFLGSRVFDDGWALASTREIAKETKTDAKQIRRDLAELAKAGLLRTATWGGSWKRRKASAHYLVPFGAMLDMQKMRRGERPQIRELIESVPTQVSPRAEPRAAESVPTSSSGEDSLRISSRADALNGPDKAKIRNRPRSTPPTARPALDKDFPGLQSRADLIGQYRAVGHSYKLAAAQAALDIARRDRVAAVPDSEYAAMVDYLRGSPYGITRKPRNLTRDEWDCYRNTPELNTRPRSEARR